MDSKPIVLGGTVPFEEEGRYHSFTYERNEAEIENPAREERRTFNETDNDSFKLSTTVECDYERTDHQLQCNTTSAQDEIAKTEGNTAVCQLLDSNSDKEDNDTKEVQRSVVYISNNRISSELKKSFQNDPRVVLIERQPDIEEGSILVGFTGSITDMFDPDTNVDLRRRTEVIDSEGKKVQFIEMTPTQKQMYGMHSICTVYMDVHYGGYIHVVHKRIKKEKIYNYREVLAGINMPKISPAIFCVIENDDNNIDLFMEYINPNISLHDMISVEKKLGKCGAYYVINILSKAVNELHIGGWIHGDLHGKNILFRKTENGIIIKIIDYGYSKELVGNESKMGYDLSMIAEVISNLIKSWIGENDHLLTYIQGDKWVSLTPKEKVEYLITETAVESARFVEEQNAMNKHELLKELFK